MAVTNLSVWCALIALCSSAAAQAEVSQNPPVPSVESATDAAIAAPAEHVPPVPPSEGPQAPEASEPQNANTGTASVAPDAADVFAPEQPANPAIANGYLSPKNEWNTSVMFVPSQMRKLRQVVEVYEENREYFASSQSGEDAVEDILKWDVGMNKADGAGGGTLPSFFLASIVYYKDNDWSVWLGGRKIMFEDNSENAELFIESVTKSQVTAVWRPSALDRVLATWSKDRLTESMQEGGDVFVDRKTGIIRFTLKPNQSFNSGLSKVVEGKSAPLQMASTSKPSAGAILSDVPAAPKLEDDSISRMVQSQQVVKDPEQISKELMEQYTKIGKFVPKRNAQ